MTPFKTAFYPGKSVSWGICDEKPNAICRRCSYPVVVGFAFFERRFRKGKERGLRLRLPADEILLVHDRSQNGGAVCLWNPGRTAHEGSRSGQRLGERESRCSLALTRMLVCFKRSWGSDGLPNSSLCFMPALSHPLPDWVQSVCQRVLCCVES